MTGKINKFFREYIYGLSIFTAIIGVVVLIFGVLGILTNILQDSLDINRDLLEWSPYIFGLGVIVFLVGIYYLYSYLKNKRFFIAELDTNKRSEFVKKHQEIKNSVKYLPKKVEYLITK